MSRVAEICKIDEKTLTQVQFVSKTKYYMGKGYVELCLNEHIRPYVLELKERFTEIELVMLSDSPVSMPSASMSY